MWMIFENSYEKTIKAKERIEHYKKERSEQFNLFLIIHLIKS